MEKAYSMREQMDNVIKEMKILRKNKREMLGIKNTVREMKNDFDWLIGRLDMAEVRISELEIIIETSRIEKQKEKKPEKNKTEYLKTVEKL